MAQKFQVGDTVQLKSGGPVMTVERYGTGTEGSRPGMHGPTNSVKCLWFEGVKLHSRNFHEDMLELVTKGQDQGVSGHKKTKD